MLALNEAYINDQVNLLKKEEIIKKYRDFLRLVYENGFLILPRYQKYDREVRNRIRELEMSQRPSGRGQEFFDSGRKHESPAPANCLVAGSDFQIPDSSQV
jgi:hypothetical protein